MKRIEKAIKLDYNKLEEELNNLKKTSQSEKEKLQALLDISSGLYESKTFEDIGKTIEFNLSRFNPGGGFGVKLGIYDSVADSYKIVFQTEPDTETNKRIILLSNKTYKLSEVKYYSKIAIEQKKTLFIEDNHSDFSLEIDNRHRDVEGQSMVFIPLFYRADLVGLLSCARTPEKSMDQDFIEFLESIGKYVSISIGDLLMDKRQGDQLRLLTLLDISSGLYRAETFEDIGKTVVNNLDRFKLGEAIGTKLAVYDLDEDSFFIAFQTGATHEAHKKVLVPTNEKVSIKDIKYFSRITIEKRETLIIQENHSEYSLSIDVRQKTFPKHSMIFIPLFSGDNLIGLLSFARSPENSMDPAFVDFLESVAKYVSLAVSKTLNEKRRKKIEQEILESEKRYRSLVDTSPDGIAFTDLAGTILLCNQKIIEMQGYEKIVDLINENIFKIVAPEYLKDVKRDMKRLLSSGSIKNVEYELLRKDGSHYSAEVSATLVRDAKKKPYRVIATARDITDRKQAEEAIAYERYLFKTLMDTIPDSIYFKDKESKFVRINKALAKLFNLTNTEEAIGKTDYDFFTKERSEEPFKDEQQILNTGQPIVNKDEIEKWPDGRTTWVSTTKMPLKDNDGHIIGSFGISRDITDRKLMEQTLWNEKEELRVTLRSLGDGVIATNNDGKIVLLNKKAEEVLGWNSEEAFNRPISDVFVVTDINDNQMYINPIKLLLRESSLEIFSDQSILVTKDRKNRIIYYNVSSIKNREGSLIGFIIAFRDITEQKRIETQYALSQKMESIGQLAAGIAHEINTPMQYIGDNTRFLQDSFKEIDELMVWFDKIENSIDNHEECDSIKANMKSIMQKIDLDYLRAEIPSAIEQSLSGIERVRNIVLAMKDFVHPGNKAKSFSNINHGIEVTVTISRNEWKYVAELETKLQKDLPNVFCNLDEINQVILNMIVNAAHAIKDVIINESTEKGKIIIVTEADGDFAVIKISDTGKGIPKENRNRIFDPFFTTKEVGKGTGQGLAIAHDIIVNKHKGKIDLESEIGKGTTFILRLPINEPKIENKK